MQHNYFQKRTENTKKVFQVLGNLIGGNFYIHITGYFSNVYTLSL